MEHFLKSDSAEEVILIQKKNTLTLREVRRIMELKCKAEIKFHLVKFEHVNTPREVFYRDPHNCKNAPHDEDDDEWTWSSAIIPACTELMDDFLTFHQTQELAEKQLSYSMLMARRYVAALLHRNLDKVTSQYAQLVLPNVTQVRRHQDIVAAGLLSACNSVAPLTRSLAISDLLKYIEVPEKHKGDLGCGICLDVLTKDLPKGATVSVTRQVATGNKEGVETSSVSVVYMVEGFSSLTTHHAAELPRRHCSGICCIWKHLAKHDTCPNCRRNFAHELGEYQRI
ncbi:hypothetical protein BJ878DRAFT_561588 [Calycina marina]|uniref:Uncharacterized protein n=1 Tax=Calycina marina TaxID=1763456 RepID=A0A9P7YUL2_9HELO|nr:hypothetical protein BJ878DRAFT_561588 [Calycina marina]